MNGGRERRRITVPDPALAEMHLTLTGEYELRKPMKQIVLRQGHEREYRRHLGNYQNNVGGTKAAIDEARKTIDHDLQYMVQRKITQEAALQGYNTKIKPKHI